MNNDRVLLAHGSGGRLSHDLVSRVFVRHFSNPVLDRLDDSALLDVCEPIGTQAMMNVIEGVAARDDISSPPIKLALTTDSYVVTPIFFPGGDIGKLAVCGTVNDLCMSGAKPLFMTAGFIIEEGLPLADLERVAGSMADTARDAGVSIVAGDTKVVDRGHADRLFINTSGLGIVPSEVDISATNAHPGDVVLTSGTLGDHGMAILMQREGLEFSSPLESDCAPLNGLVHSVFKALGAHSESSSAAIHCLRDPTRGGLVTALNELAQASNVGIELDEPSIPIRDSVRAACELLGLDPLYVANEGKLVAIAAPEVAEQLLGAMRGHPYGANACIIGTVTDSHPAQVILRTSLGARRIVDMLTGEQLPRIC